MSNLSYRHGTNPIPETMYSEEQEWTQYRSNMILELTPWSEDCKLKFNMRATDQMNGSPKIGDMIARDYRKPYITCWLIAKENVDKLLEPIV